MAEWKRILRNRRLCIGLLIILLLNGFLFLRDQKTQDYRIDGTIPTFTISINTYGGGYKVAQKSVDSREGYDRYLQWLENYKDPPIAEALTDLETEKERLTTILQINELLESDSDMFLSDSLEQYRAEYPEFVRQLENGELDLNEVHLDYVAVNHLLRQAKYLDSYDDYLTTIRANKEKMLSFSIFNDPDSFSGRNIIKTANEFEALESVSLTLGADGAITALMNFSITDYMLLAVLVLICISFLDERKKGLWGVVHSAPNGRLRLALQRAGILLGVSVIGVVLLYGSNLLMGFSVYGGMDDLGRAAQSVELLGKMPVCCTVGEFLLLYLLFKVGASFLVALLLWLIFTAINNVKYTMIAAAGVLATEYSLYTFLPVQSGLNVFKYFNIFTYITASDLYTNYLNIDLFGYPVGIRAVSQYACLPLILILAAACITIHCHKRPAAGKDLLGRFVYGVNRVTDGFLCRFHLLGMELHKTLAIQKGVLILVLFLYLVTGLTFTVNIPVSSTTEASARKYTSELAGAITEDTLQQIEDIQAELDATLAAHEEARVQYENGEMEYPQYNVFARAADSARTKSDGLAIVRARVEELRSLGEEKDFTPWLIEESPYKGTYSDEASANQQSAALVAMLTVVLLLAGSFAYETQSGMNYPLASTMRGRKALLRRKIGMAAILTTVIWAVTYGLEFHAFLGICDTGTFVASVQNLSLLEKLPIRCNIGVFLVGLYLLRLVALFTCAMLTMLISSFMKRLETAYISACGVILLPSVLYLYLGLKPLKYLSLVLSVMGMPLLIESNGTSGTLPCVAILLVIVIAMCSYGLQRIRSRYYQL